MTGAVAVDGRRTEFNRNLVNDWDKTTTGWAFGTNTFTRELVPDAYTGQYVARAVADNLIHDLGFGGPPTKEGDLFIGELWCRRVDTGSVATASWHLGATATRSGGLGPAYPVFSTLPGAGTTIAGQVKDLPTTWTKFVGYCVMPASTTGVTFRVSLRGDGNIGTIEADGLVVRKIRQ